jgi:selenocysteine-specific elongation factor
MIVGTAGHIDHGKTSLVRALTGVNTDRLKEEKLRGITIDLGFAYMNSQDGEVIGFIDVPGHERLVHNMLAGATGIDYVLLTIAADDGPKPQTVEHLRIVDLLGISRGAVVVSKIDKIPETVRDQLFKTIRGLLQGTTLAGAKIIPVSIVTGEGIDDLRMHLMKACSQRIVPSSTGFCRMQIDRCFLLTGTGIVVTGTVMAGQIRKGDHVMLSPSGIEARVRGLHVQSLPAIVGSVGQRCAVNLSGPQIEKASIARGDWLVARDIYAPTLRFDARIQYWDSEKRRLKHWTQVHLHHGACDVTARVALLTGSEIASGESALAQIVLQEPIGALARDRFILRDQSAKRTLAGGYVIDPFPLYRRRRSKERQESLEQLDTDDYTKALRDVTAVPPGWVDLQRFVISRNLTPLESTAAQEDANVVVAVADGRAVACQSAKYEALRHDLHSTLTQYHLEHPDLAGVQVSSLSTMMATKPDKVLFKMLLHVELSNKTISIEGARVRLREHRPELASEDESFRIKIEQLLFQSGYKPPRPEEMARLAGIEERLVRSLLKRLSQTGKAIEVTKDHFFSREIIGQMAATAAEVGASHETNEFSAVEFRDALGVGRRVAIEVLEYFDRSGVTARRGDLRRIMPRWLVKFGDVASVTARQKSD